MEVADLFDDVVAGTEKAPEDDALLDAYPIVRSSTERFAYAIDANADAD
ncbi:hypothetical protein [Phyllobacterium phragmitis]|nr:hypothetical protein [Phyllobacterium phragmitis]